LRTPLARELTTIANAKATGFWNPTWPNSPLVCVLVGADHEPLVKAFHHPCAWTRSDAPDANCATLLVLPKDGDVDDDVLAVHPHRFGNRRLVEQREQRIVPEGAKLLETAGENAVSIAAVHNSPFRANSVLVCVYRTVRPGAMFCHYGQ
jgi:hypothetical protein